MDREKQIISPNYRQIFLDVLDYKYPEKKEKCLLILSKTFLSVIDVIELNKIIFDTDEERNKANQKYRSYTKSTILEILDYQRQHNLNNSQLANHFKLSRNTISKWKKKFLYS